MKGQMETSAMTFTVHCSGCNAGFPIDSAKVPYPGVYAQCSECETVFLVRTPSDAPAEGEASVEAPVEAPVIDEVAPPIYQAGPAYEAVPDFEPAMEAPAVGPAPDLPELPEVPDAPAFSEPEPPEFSEPEPPAFSEPEPVPDAFSTPDPFQAPPEVSAPAAPEQIPEAAEPMVSAPVEEPAPAFEAPAPAAPEPAPTPSPFGRRDPHERARRLARVLVSDMIAYYPDRHRQSLRAGTLAKDFEEEIEKSWSEYVDQVGKDMADGTTYFKDALNEVLAEGNEVF